MLCNCFGQINEYSPITVTADATQGLVSRGMYHAAAPAYIRCAPRPLKQYIAFVSDKVHRCHVGPITAIVHVVIVPPAELVAAAGQPVVVKIFGK